MRGKQATQVIEIFHQVVSDEGFRSGIAEIGDYLIQSPEVNKFLSNTSGNQRLHIGAKFQPFAGVRVPRNVAPIVVPANVFTGTNAFDLSSLNEEGRARVISTSSASTRKRI